MRGPPLGEWAHEGALRELERIARRLPFEDFDRDVVPRLRRLTEDQRAAVLSGQRALIAGKCLQLEFGSDYGE